MATKIPERFTWAVETLAVEPHEHLLEIGCGSGVAVSLICEQLATGKITAIDQSPKMIAAATQRNQSCIASGKAVFHTAALSDFAGEQFHKIFAVNVNVFWLKPAQEFRVIKNLLLPAGRLYLFYEPPSASQILFDQRDVIQAVWCVPDRLTCRKRLTLLLPTCVPDHGAFARAAGIPARC
jgi:SAM-dependent methyltransferase